MEKIILTVNAILESTKIKSFFQKLAYFFVDPYGVPNKNGDLPNDSEMLSMLKFVKWDHVILVVAIFIALIVLGNIKSNIVRKNKAKKAAKKAEKDNE